MEDIALCNRKLTFISAGEHGIFRIMFNFKDLGKVTPNKNYLFIKMMCAGDIGPNSASYSACRYLHLPNDTVKPMWL